MINRLFLGILMLSLFLGACKQSNKEDKIAPQPITTTYYLIRHAEKDRNDTTDTNPPLSQIGDLRALNWQQYFDSIPLAEIYSTQYTRTQQTVLPTATAKNITIESYEPKSLITPEFLRKTQGKFILISGHSNTTPKMVNQLMGAELYPDMNDLDNSSLYVVRFQDSIPRVEIRKINLPRE